MYICIFPWLRSNIKDIQVVIFKCLSLQSNLQLNLPESPTMRLSALVISTKNMINKARSSSSSVHTWVLVNRLPWGACWLPLPISKRKLRPHFIFPHHTPFVTSSLISSDHLRFVPRRLGTGWWQTLQKPVIVSVIWHEWLTPAWTGGRK